MKIVMQTRFGEPEGNCFEACVATVLGLDLDQVFDRYVTLGAEMTVPQERKLIGDWLADRGLGLAVIGVSFFDGAPRIMATEGVSMIVVGRPPRGGMWHAVVWKMEGGEWRLGDPHPEGGGIERVDSVEIIVRRHL